MPFDNPILNAEKPEYLKVSEALRRRAERLPWVQIFPHFLGRGDRGEELVCQEFRFGDPEAENMLVFDSGIHGIEGAAGSAIFWDILEESRFLSGVRGFQVRLIDTINPYGFYHFCRYNESGVDLNRNFVPHPCTKRNEVYENLYHQINPESLDLLKEARCLAELKLSSWFRGKVRLMQAIAAGQYRFPKGVQFGGVKPAPENRIVRKIIRTLPKTLRRLVWINTHSGLGSPRQVQFMCEYPEGSHEHLQLASWFGDLLTPPREVEQMTTNPGNLGAIDQAVREEVAMIAPAAQVVTTCMEIGTYGTMRSVWAVRARNWARHFGYRDEAAVGKIKEWMARVFFPPVPAWREALRRAGKEALARSLLAFMEPVHF